MRPTLFLAFTLAPAAASAQPNFYMMPQSVLDEMIEPRDKGMLGGGDLTPGIDCATASLPGEMVVCGRRGRSYGPPVIDPEMMRRYARRPAGPDAGIRTPSSAMEASRCAIVRCPPEGMIGIVGRRF